MDAAIKELSDQMHKLFLEIMQKDPWEPGYGEVVAIHEFLSKVLRDKAQKGMDEFSSYLTTAAEEINETWQSNKSMLKNWSTQLKPVFEIVERITKNAVPLLRLIL
ncbi:hypothetical protein [Rheinheimera oceanensis]|uniref:hypothetical protein n=1 Tax=Rheinheimera oceanensis TaxID=2817449 RepID=UPI001BFE8889|nr:hypothetical protein [Rheinheimera oceanensis]